MKLKMTAAADESFSNFEENFYKEISSVNFSIFFIAVTLDITTVVLVEDMPTDKWIPLECKYTKHHINQVPVCTKCICKNCMCSHKTCGPS